MARIRPTFGVENHRGRCEVLHVQYFWRNLTSSEVQQWSSLHQRVALEIIKCDALSAIARSQRIASTTDFTRVLVLRRNQAQSGEPRSGKRSSEDHKSFFRQGHAFQDSLVPWHLLTFKISVLCPSFFKFTNPLFCFPSRTSTPATRQACITKSSKQACLE